MYGDFETAIRASSCSKPEPSVSCASINTTSTSVSFFGGKTAYPGEIAPCGSFIILKMQTHGNAPLFSIFKAPTLISVTYPDPVNEGSDTAPKMIVPKIKIIKNRL